MVSTKCKCKRDISSQVYVMSAEKVWNGYLPSREVGMPWLLQLVVLKKLWNHALAFID